MPDYRQKLIHFLTDIQDGLCDDCRRRIATNPIRVLDCKVESCQRLLADAPTMPAHLCDDCRHDFDTLTALLSDAGIPFEKDDRLVRGLDYYTRTAFEFVSDAIGAQSAIAGGGRYNRLVEFLGGKPTPAVGFAIGIERIMPLIELPSKMRRGTYLGVMEEAALPAIMQLAHRLRQKEPVTVEYRKKSLKAHLKAADRVGALRCGIIGSDELAAHAIWIKNLETKEENRLALDAVD
jgi:histidyl-tRNA synthetase